MKINTRYEEFVVLILSFVIYTNLLTNIALILGRTNMQNTNM